MKRKSAKINLPCCPLCKSTVKFPKTLSCCPDCGVLMKKTEELLVVEYFYKDHNRSIDEKEGYYATAPASVRELSKVDIAKVASLREDVLTVEYKGNENKIRTRNVFNHFTPQAKQGDKVRIHYGYAVEIVPE